MNTRPNLSTADNSSQGLSQLKYFTDEYISCIEKMRAAEKQHPELAQYLDELQDVYRKTIIRMLGGRA